MLNFSYTLSPLLKKDIENIDIIRSKIMCELIPPPIEIEMRFESLCKKISSALFLSGKSISHYEIKSIIEGSKKHLHADEIIKLKNAYDYVTRNWLLADNEVTVDSIMDLLQNYSDSKLRDKKQLNLMIEFINTNPEHGIVQGGLAFFLMSQALVNDNNNIKISSNASNIYMFKHGYDFRGLLNLEASWVNDLATLNKIIKEARDTKNLSRLLEFYVSTISIQAENILATLRDKSQSSRRLRHRYELTPRQKKILSLFDVPDVKITNRDLQNEFKISQITASRDLSKLSAIGLIFTNGRGRSVYYTKV